EPGNFLTNTGEVFMRQVKVWPHVTLIALLCALVSGAAAALWMRHQRHDEAQALNSGAARVERVDGEVGINRDVKDGTDAQWVQATTNTPVSAGDRIYARDNSRAS